MKNINKKLNFKITNHNEIDSSSDNSTIVELGDEIFIFEKGYIQKQNRVLGNNYFISNSLFLKNNIRRIKGLFISNYNEIFWKGIFLNIEFWKNINIYVSKETYDYINIFNSNACSSLNIIIINLENSNYKEITFDNAIIQIINFESNTLGNLAFKIINKTDLENNLLYINQFLMDPKINYSSLNNFGKINDFFNNISFLLLGPNNIRSKGYAYQNTNIEDVFSRIEKINRENRLFLILNSFDTFRIKDILNKFQDKKISIFSTISVFFKEFNFVKYEDSEIILISGDNSQIYQKIQKILDSNSLIKFNKTDNVILLNDIDYDLESYIINLNAKIDSRVNKLFITTYNQRKMLANSLDIALLLSFIKPKILIPINGNIIDNVNFSEVVSQNSFDITFANYVNSGQVFLLTSNNDNSVSLFDQGQINLNKDLMKSNDKNYDNKMLNDKLELLKTGILLVTLKLKNRQLVSNINFHSKGSLFIRNTDFFSTSLTNVVNNTLANFPDSNIDNLESKLSHEITKIVRSNYDWKPIIKVNILQ